MFTMWDIASGTTGNTDNSINAENINISITKPVNNADDVMNEFVGKLNSGYYTTNNQR